MLQSMSRRPRVHVSAGIYHVTLRGNHRQPIFFEPEDRQLLEDFLAQSLRRFDCRIHAYCWMTNHLHMAVQIGHIPLGDFVRHLASRYARAVQRRTPTTGHLFERRYGTAPTWGWLGQAGSRSTGYWGCWRLLRQLPPTPTGNFS